MAAERGIGMNLTLFMKLKLPDTPDSFETVRPYLQRTIDRLAKHPNIFCWEVHNEHTSNPKFQTQVGRFMKASDPKKRPVISSDGTTDNFQKALLVGQVQSVRFDVWVKRVRVI